MTLTTAALLYLIPFIMTTIFVEMESFGYATTIMGIALVIYSYINKFIIFSYIELNWFYCLKLIFVYLAIGIAWSFVKWFLFLIGFKAAFNRAKKEYIDNWNQTHTDNKITNYIIPKERFDHFRREISHKRYKEFWLSSKPLAFMAKNKIIGWMAFWPCSMVGFIFNDPIRRLLTFVFDLIINSYQKIADKIFFDSELK